MPLTEETPVRLLSETPPEAATADEATRYLCAAAHIDLGWSGSPGTQVRQCVNDVLLDERLRAAGVSPGVDLRRVAVECRRAAGRKFTRDAALLGVLLLLVLVLALTRSAPAAVFLILLAVEIVHFEAWFSTHRIVARRMLRGQFTAEDPATASRELDYIREAQEGNVTVYSGYGPFAGVGFSHGGWSFAINLSEGAQGIDRPRTPRPISIPELYARVVTDIDALDVPGMEQRDHVFVDGRRLREEPRLLLPVKDVPARPHASLPAAEVQALVGKSGERLRHYKVIRVNAWGGELVVSVFVRFMKVEQALFAEVSYFLLPPLNEACHIADRISPTPGWRDHVRLIASSVVMTPVALWRAFGGVKSHVFHERTVFKRAKRARIQAQSDPSYDFGAPPSVRQIQMSGHYRQYFQQLDRDMYVKVIEERLLDSLINYLDEHDIDTGDLRMRSMTVMNNGVMMTGGTLQAENIAAGSKARAQSAPKAA
jgi:hypothetical protein